MSDYIVLQKKKKCTCGKSLLTSDHMRRQDASQSQWWQLLALHMTGTVSVWCVWTRRSGHPQLQPQEKSIQLLNCLNSTVILPSKYFVQRHHRSNRPQANHHCFKIHFKPTLRTSLSHITSTLVYLWYQSLLLFTKSDTSNDTVSKFKATLCKTTKNNIKTWRTKSKFSHQSPQKFIPKCLPVQEWRFTSCGTWP